MSESDPIFSDMQLLLAESRELALLYKHGFIDHSHFFVAMLRSGCAAGAYCKDFNVSEWEEWLQNLHPANENEEEEGNAPLTVIAANMYTHATTIAGTNGNEEVNSVHILLALLCFNDEVTRAFSKKGIVFEDIAEDYYKRTVPKTVPEFLPRRKKPFSRFDKFLFTPESREREIQHLTADAYELYNYGLYDDCLKVCEIALGLDPSNSSILIQRIHCYSAKREFDSALKYLKELLTGHPPLKLTYGIWLAGFYDELERYNEAHTLLVELMDADPNNADLQNGMGFHLYLQGRYAEAIPYFEKSIAIKPDYAYPWDNLGFVLYKLGQKERALELIEKSLELDRGNSFAYKYKGIIFLEEGNKEEALRNFQLALRYGYTATYGDEVLELMKKI